MYSGVAKLCHDSCTTGICRSTGRSAIKFDLTLKKRVALNTARYRKVHKVPQGRHKVPQGRQKVPQCRHRVLQGDYVLDDEITPRVSQDKNGFNSNGQQLLDFCDNCKW